MSRPILCGLVNAAYALVVLLQISDYPSGVAVISGGFGRLVSAKFTDDSSHSCLHSCEGRSLLDRIYVL